MKCDFCKERKGEQTVLNTIYGDFDRIVHETENFVVFPCLGQLREGHLLVVSKTHINAAGNFGSTQLCELDSVVKEVCGFIEQEYGTAALIFEHGVLDDTGANGGCGISHMHLHILPANDEELYIIERVLKKDQAIDVQKVGSFSDAATFAKAGKTYIFWGKAGKTGILSAQILTSKTNYFESQYMRKIVANEFGKLDWNWKDCTSPEPELYETFWKAKSFFNT